MATIVTRSGKGSPLTNTEMDANLTNLNSDKAELTTAEPTGTGQTDGLMSHEDKLKLDSVETSANNYDHPTADGSLHVPATGTDNDGKILTSGDSAGSASWQDAPVSLPTQTDPETVDKYLKSNGSTASWAEVAGGGASTFNDLTDGTMSESDPTITSCEDADPDLAVGHIWVNKTSGEAYICTVSTVDNNVWTNIGGGSGNITPQDAPNASAVYSTPSTITFSHNTQDNVVQFTGAQDSEDGTALDWEINLTSGDTDFLSITPVTVTDTTISTFHFDTSEITDGEDKSVTFEVVVTDSAGASDTKTGFTMAIQAIGYPVLDNNGTSEDPTTCPINSNYRILTFLSGGYFKFSSAGSENQVEYLIIGGGGAGSTESSGGGGGGYKTSYASETSGGTCGNLSTIDMSENITYTVAVGAGGSSGSNGVPSSVSGSGLTTITAYGGGASGNTTGDVGSSGGFSGSTARAPDGCGNAGGTSNGGGGGAGGVGSNSYGNGGAGLTSYIGSQAGVCRSGGGNRSSAANGQCGGGNRTQSGFTNTGGGGGGLYANLNGGSGIVIIRYQVS